MKRTLGTVGFLLLLSAVTAIFGCQRKEISNSSPNSNPDRIGEILKIPGDEERRNELLLYHLENKSNNAAMVYLGRELLLQGRIEEARIYLRAPLGISTDGRAESLSLYLRAYLAFFEQDYRQAERLLSRFKALDSAPREKGEGEGEGNDKVDLDSRVDLLQAAVMIGLGEDLGEAADILLALWKRDQRLLNERRLLELIELLQHLGRVEESKTLLSDAGRTRPYNQNTSPRWVRLAEAGGMEFLEETGRVEDLLVRDIISSAEISGNTLQDALLTAFESEQWQRVEEIVNVLKEKHSHRLLPFLDALCRLKTHGAGKGELELFQHTGAPYRETQFYYYHLWKGLDDMGDVYRPLMKEALTASILVAPPSSRADEARRRLALLYGLEGEGGPAPLTELEMKRLGEFVMRGAPVEVLGPVLEFLEWPENPCTLQAGLVLREVRDVPGVRELMEDFLSGSGDRARERLESILHF